ncbi:MAG: ABC transporter ATP-binding protein [Gammaproteobacteria bacterium]|nr:ABC transporter ATP-binding protein [Gammaproteobacteria bacterium]MDH5801342.1 ABC transporter ATP-binding protein [Gammaproteobacteria bacterium]
MIQLQDVSKTYYLGNVPVPVLRHVSLHVPQGQFVAIMGPSGSGKTTLLNIIGCLDSVDTGKYLFARRPVGLASEAELASIRNRHIGFVFQSFNLIPRISALRNVELPMVYAGVSVDLRKHRALAALDIVGLRSRADHSAAQMSGGQQQRVAIARALVNSPDLIIADEPTGALDSNTSHEIMQIFTQLNQSGKTIVMVTHEHEVAAYASRIVQVKDGKLLEQKT